MWRIVLGPTGEERPKNRSLRHADRCFGDTEQPRNGQKLSGRDAVMPLVKYPAGGWRVSREAAGASGVEVEGELHYTPAVGTFERIVAKAPFDPLTPIEVEVLSSNRCSHH